MSEGASGERHRALGGTGVLLHALPLLGVAFLDWSATEVIVAYWIESGLIGAATLAKIASSRGGKPTGGDGQSIPLSPRAAKILTGGFYTFHYGIFWIAHGVFVFALFGAARWSDTLLLVAVIGIAQVLDVGRFRATEAAHADPQALIGPTYARVVALHLTVIGAGFLLGASDLHGHTLAVAALVVLRIVFEISGFGRRPKERRAAAHMHGLTEHEPDEHRLTRCLPVTDEPPPDWFWDLPPMPPQVPPPPEPGPR